MKFPLRLYRVAGSSMLPNYRAGDVVLGWRWSSPRVGQTVIARIAERPVIKRVKKLEAGLVWVEGDNQAASTDSRHYGDVARDQIEAVIWGRISRTMI